MIFFNSFKQEELWKYAQNYKNIHFVMFPQ